MFENKIYQLKGEGSVIFHDPLLFSAIKKMLSDKNISLPTEHVDLLKFTDGLECYGGYFRLFGLRETKRINLFSWNSNDLWKFSWDGKLDSFLCFGGTAWGDQYAYCLNSDGRIISTAIYYIEGITMAPEVISDSFESFFTNEILRNADKPYDEITINVRNRLGDLSIDEHIVYMPSPLIGGMEDPANVQKMDAVASMIVNGDLCMQLAAESQDRPIKELRPYVDECGRTRLKVVWLNN